MKDQSVFLIPNISTRNGITMSKTRFHTGEESPYTKARFKFDGYMDGTWSPSPTSEEKEIELTFKENFPPIRSSGKSRYWLLT
jgi:hypothetical protein